MIVQEIAVQMGARWDYRSVVEVTNEITERVPLYAGLTYERLTVTARRRSSVLTTGGESVEPVQIALGELYGDVSGLPWRSVAEGEPNAKFDMQWIEPGVAKDDASGHPADAPKGHLYALAVARSLYDRGTLVNASEIVQSRVPPPTLELNSHDAEDLGLEDGMAVRAILEMKPPRTFELNARVDGHVPPGVVLIPNNLDGAYNLPMGMQVRIEKV
jgi:formate dehydrogenase major subunit